ncbi:unnamed protein product, partial [Coccothraustes coccothraustes]
LKPEAPGASPRELGGQSSSESLFSPCAAVSGWAEAEPQRSSEVPGHWDVTAPTRM